MVGSAEQSGGGVSSVIRLIRKMPVWEKYSCYWLGTQIQRNYLWKFWYALKANFTALFIIWRYDIVHIHTVPDKPGLTIQLPVMLLALLLRKRIIVHIHMGNQLKDHTANGFFRWYLEKADRVVILAECFRDIIVEGYGIDSDKIAVVYNAADGSNRCDDNSLAGGNESVRREKTIIMAGYFDENKAPDVLMRSLTLSLPSREGTEQYPADAFHGWKVILMGNGNVDKYRDICHELGLDNIVSFPGYVTGAQKENIWRTASILCLCSHVEGFPMVVLEAWNYGIPVISTPVGGLPDVIEEGRNCLTFGFDDIDGLSRQLTRLMADERLRQEMGEYGSKFVREHFSIDTVNRQLDELYGALNRPLHSPS